MATKMKAVTVRLPEHLYNRGAVTAKRKNLSLNRLLQESLEAAIKAEEDRELYEAFGLVGREEDNDVEYAFEAQREVVLRDEE